MDTAGLTLEAVGAYIKLICVYWTKESLQNDIQTLNRIVGADISKVWPSICGYFEPRDGQLYLPELDRYRQELIDHKAKQSANGKKGANKRWEKESHTNGDPNGYPNSDSIALHPSPSTYQISAEVYKKLKKEYEEITISSLDVQSENKFKRILDGFHQAEIEEAFNTLIDENDISLGNLESVLNDGR